MNTAIYLCKHVFTDIISFMNFDEKMKMLYLDDIESILLNLEQKYLAKKISYEI